MPDQLKIIPLEYPGRNARINESLLSSVDDLANDLFNQVRMQIHDMPYAIYGHSLGSLVGLQLTRRIVAEGLPRPLHLFVTGTCGPSKYAHKKRFKHLLPKDELIREVINLNGSEKGVLDHPELAEYFEPIFRADFKAAETYSYTEAVLPDIPITVITGTEEPMHSEDILSWQHETTGITRFYRMPGGHFFIYDHAPAIMDIISERIFH